jgi:hypothetical protein
MFVAILTDTGTKKVVCSAHGEGALHAFVELNEHLQNMSPVDRMAIYDRNIGVNAQGDLNFPNNCIYTHVVTIIEVVNFADTLS